MRDTIDMAREASNTPPDHHATPDLFGVSQLERFAALVRADERDRAMRENAYVLAEREACAKVCDLVAREMDDTNGTTSYIGKLIRARGNT